MVTMLRPTFGMTEPPHRIRRWAAWVVLALSLVPAALFAWKMRHFEHLGYFHDDGMYWVSARSLASGQGYRILSYPGAPLQTKYPPVLPLLLAGVWKLFPAFPENMPWAMAVVALMLPAFLWTMLRLLESWGCSRPLALVLCAWTALNPYIIFFSLNLMPELLVSALLGCCFLAARNSAIRESPAAALLAGALGGVAYLTKASVLPLLAAGPIWYAFKKQVRLAAWFASPLLLAVLSWNMWSARHMMHSKDIVAIYYTSYLGDFLHDLRGTEWLTFFVQNIPTFLSSAGNLLIPDVVGIPLLGPMFPRLVGIFAIVGIIRQARKDGLGLHHWFCAGFCLQLLVWQYPPNERFLIPIVPVIVFGAQAELRHLLRMLVTVWRSADRGQRVAAAIIASAAAMVTLWAGAMVAVGNLVLLPSIAERYHRQFESSRKAYLWMKQNLAPGERVLTYYDAPVFLYSGLQAVRPRNFPKEFYRHDRAPIIQAFRELPATARRHGIGYALLTDADFDLDPFLKETVDWNKLASSSPYYLLYRAPLASVYEIQAQP
jgi:hypothetical protein